jgi:hypothetical protein
MINKNDCFDCANCRPIFSGEWICDVTQENIPEQGIVEDGDCENFKYEE